MKIKAFSDIPNFMFVIGAMPGLGTLDKTGNVINSVTSGEVGEYNFTIPTAGTATLQHDGSTMTGKPLEAIFDEGNGVNSHFLADFAANGYTFGTDGASAVWVEERRNLDNGNNSFGTFSGAARTQCWTARRGSNAGSPTGYSYELRAGSQDLVGAEAPMDINTPYVLYYSHNKTTENEAQFYQDGVGYGPFTYALTPRTETLIRIMSIDGASMNGKMGLFALYNRQLTAEERTDVIELAQYWLDNGEAPTNTAPPQVTFGPVATNNDPAVTGWQWEESNNSGSSWADVGTILTDVSGQTTTSLTVNSAIQSQDQTWVRCRADHANGSSFSNHAVLTVVTE